MSDFEARLQRLIQSPESLQGFWVELAAPVWRWLEFSPQLRVECLREYVGIVSQGTNLPELWPSAARAHAEFDASLRSLERAQRLFKTVDPQLINWAERILRVLLQADRARDSYQANDRQRARAVAQALMAAAPTAFSHLEPAPAQPELVRIRIDSVEALVRAAHAETDFLGRRRNMLQAARELLIDSADQIADQAAVGTRLEGIGREIGELDRLQALGVRPDVALPHQLRAALAEKKSQRVNGILTTMESYALVSLDERVQDLSRAALDQLWRGRDRFAAENASASLVRSGSETFQEALRSAAERGHEAAKTHLNGVVTELTEEYGIHFAREAHRYVHGDATNELIQAALYVDGCVDVGGVLSPHRVFESTRTIHEVRHPTARMELVAAQAVDELKDALIQDPRTLLTDLATGRLLTRRYIGEQVHERERRVMASEARIFLLDGSGSMLGPRARMRDAILVAELSTMIARLNDPNRWLTPTLYYRYFTRRLGDVCKVSTADDAIAAVEKVLGEVRHGGTDIEGALLGSFETLKQAQASADSELARAQIILITDGESPIDEAAITTAKEQVGAVPVGVSIIALGQENPALRTFARNQRDRGQRVFYQHLDDALLQRLAEGKLGALPLHLPDELSDAPPTETLTKLLDEIAAVQRTRETDALQRARDVQSASTEVGVSATDALAMSEQARILTLSRDTHTLDERFGRWFPKLSAPTEKRNSDVGGLHRAVESKPPTAVMQPSDMDLPLLETIRTLLVAVAEVTELVGSDPAQRQLDAIEMFERLLMERRLSFLHYQRLLDRYPEALTQEVAKVRDVTACEPPRRASA